MASQRAQRAGMAGTGRAERTADPSNSAGLDDPGPTEGVKAAASAAFHHSVMSLFQSWLKVRRTLSWPQRCYYVGRSQVSVCVATAYRWIFSGLRTAVPLLLVPAYFGVSTLRRVRCSAWRTDGHESLSRHRHLALTHRTPQLSIALS